MKSQGEKQPERAGWFPERKLRWRLARQLELEYRVGLLDADDYWRELELLEEMSDE